MTNKVIWGLFDDRPGNSSQTLGLLQALEENYLSKKIIFNKLINLPNFIRGKTLIGVNKELSDNIIDDLPDIVIAAGRRLAPIARYIKAKKPTCKLIHIMWPEVGINEFDLIILPKHDKKRKNTNIIYTLGAIHKLTEQKLKEEALYLEEKLNLPRPYIALIVGGDSKHGNLTCEATLELGKISNKIASDLKGSLLITTSRRTSKEAIETLTKEITVPNYFYKYGDNSSNPYMGFLGLADKIIVTGDSISMCSEACYVGKPVFVFAPKKLVGTKHKTFLQQMYEQGFASPLSSLVKFSTITPLNHQFNKLDEAKRIAEIIKKL